MPDISSLHQKNSKNDSLRVTSDAATTAKNILARAADLSQGKSAPPSSSSDNHPSVTGEPLPKLEIVGQPRGAAKNSEKGAVENADRKSTQKSAQKSAQESARESAKEPKRESVKKNEAPNQAQLEAVEHKLKTSLEQKLGHSNREFLEAYFKKFDARVQNGQVSKIEELTAYDTVNYYLNDANSRTAVLPLEDRKRVALGILYHAADPKTINQGQHDTCSVTTIEIKMFSEHPAQAAYVIAEAAQSGIGGLGSIRIAKDDMKAGTEEAKFPPSQGARTQASKIFQTILLNDVGSFEGKQFHTEEPKGFLGELFNKLTHSTGEYWSTDHGREKFLGLTTPEMADEARMLFPGEKSLIENAKVESGWAKTWLKDDGNTLSFQNKRQVVSYLEAAKRQNQLPVIASVDGNSPLLDPEGAGHLFERMDKALITQPAPFNTMAAESIALTALGAVLEPRENHVVTIRDYNEKNDEVYVINPWGSAYSGWIKLDNLMRAT